MKINVHVCFREKPFDPLKKQKHSDYWLSVSNYSKLELSDVFFITTQELRGLLGRQRLKVKRPVGFGVKRSKGVS